MPHCSHSCDETQKDAGSVLVVGQSLNDLTGTNGSVMLPEKLVHPEVEAMHNFWQRNKLRQGYPVHQGNFRTEWVLFF
jgi:hypothetical protein